MFILQLGRVQVTQTLRNSGFRGRLTVGGKSKSLKSSNQLVLKTPKNTSSKKYHSSPIFLLARNQEDREETIKRNTENKKIFDEFVKQFGISENNDAENENEYVPRNLMDNLPDSHNDSIVSLQLPESPKKPKDTPDDFKISDYEYDLSDSENFDYLAELEEEAKKLLESTPQSSANTSKEVAAATTTNFAKQNEKEKEKTNQDSGKCSTNYFDSDEDEEAILASIPMEVFNDEHYLTKSVNKYAVNNNTGQKINLVEREQINKHRVNNSNLLEKPLAVNIAKPIGHSTVINTKQDTNCLINSNGLKQHNHTKIESKNSTSGMNKL